MPQLPSQLTGLRILLTCGVGSHLEPMPDAVQDADAELARLLDAESELVLQRRLLEALLATGSDEAEEYLFQWLEKNR